MIVKSLFLIISVLLVGLTGIAYGHTVDSVGEYRLEIGWMNEPVVSGETNGIEIFISPLDPSLPPEDQEFKNGISGLEKTLEMQLIFKEDKIELPFAEDHNIPGKYYAFVDPTTAGFYQANILGKIHDTNISLSMHPPQVHDRTYIEFPVKEPPTAQILEEHSTFQEEIDEMKETLNRIESSETNSLGFIGIGLGIVGIVIASIAISKSKK